jgi:Dullard-like phosphatase family protein
VGFGLARTFRWPIGIGQIGTQAKQPADRPVGLPRRAARVPSPTTMFRTIWAILMWIQDIIFPANPSLGSASRRFLARNYSHTKLYGPVSHGPARRATIVLDLDETLVHSTTRPTPHYDFVINVYDESGRLCTFYVLCRPHLQHFIRKVSQWYDVAVFTASKRLYADPVVDRIDRKGVVRQRLYRDSCTEVAGCFMKDLSKVRADPAKVLLVDNSPVCFSLCQNNAVPITGWVDDPNDTALLDILPFLEQVRSLRDVRSVLALRDRAASVNIQARFGHAEQSSH